MSNTHSLDLARSSSQYASIADASQTGLDITGNLTFECWVKLDQLPSTAGAGFALVSKYKSTDNNRSYVWYIDTANKLTCIFSDDGTFTTGNLFGQATADAVFTNDDLGQWVHVAITWTASTKTTVYYKNGSSVSNATAGYNNATSIYSGTADFCIGARNLGASVDLYHDGLIDDVRVWNVVRTGAQVNDNKSTELVGNESGLVGYWKLDNNYEDATSNNNDLTAYNSPTFSTDVPFSGGAPTTALVDMLGGIIPFAR
jgi:hypothetical protein